MTVHVCSLKFDAERDGGPQSVSGGDAYYLVRFPYGSNESTDPENMHAAGGHAFPDPESGLITPDADDVWGRLYAMVQWEDGSGAATNEFRDQFARNPLADTPDTTCTEHHAGTPGMQCFAKTWGIYVSSDTPLGLRVTHGASGSLGLVLAEFKLEYIT